MPYRSLPTLLAAAVLVSTALAAAAAPDLAAIRRVDATTAAEIQIALASSAAPPQVSGAAAIYVLGPKGYTLARQGSNGFACLVTRERADTLEPECFDAEGVATTLPARLFVEEQRAAGRDEASIEAALAEGYASGRFLAPRKAGIVYMLSDFNYVFDPGAQQVIHFPGHLMFYAPYATAKEVGEGPGAPYLTHPGHPDNLMVVVPARAPGY
jgi:hypothetical protein